MDRKIVYPGQIPLETDLLDTNRAVMVALGKFAAAVGGSGTFVNGLACAVTSGLGVSVAPGEIYSVQNVDDLAYSSLAADTTHTVMKQGLLADAVTFNCPAPTVAGYKINYLIQTAFQETDSDAAALPYYNAANPTQAYTGPSGSGATQYTKRKGVCVVSIKAGSQAPSASVATPSPDVGYIGLFSIQVSYGQTTLTTSNITRLPDAPFINPLGNLKGAALVAASQTFTLSDSGKFLQYVGTSAATFTFPSAVGVAGRQYVVWNNSSYNLTLASSNCYFLSPAAATTFTVKPQQVVVFVSDNFNWVFSSNTALLPEGAQLQASPPNTDYSNAVATTKWISDNMATFSTAWGFQYSFGTNGYIKLPGYLGGIVIQWGQVVTDSANASTGTTFSFPVVFPNFCYQVIGSDSANAVGVISFQPISTSQFKAWSAGGVGQTWSYQSYTGRYFAIGR